jgi:hypothetical protein
MTRIASLKFAAAFVAVLSVPSLAMAAATGGGGGGGAGGDGGLSFAAPTPTTQINLPPTHPQPMQGTPATTNRPCSFEFLRGHFCEMRRQG